MIGFNSGAGATTMSPYLTPINTAQPAAISSTGQTVPSVGASSVSGVLTSQPMIMFFAMIALILAVKWISEGPASMEVAHIHVGGYNFLMITAIAIVGIDLFKLIFTRWHVPGLSPVIQMA